MGDRDGVKLFVYGVSSSCPRSLIQVGHCNLTLFEPCTTVESISEGIRQVWPSGRCFHHRKRIRIRHHGRHWGRQRRHQGTKWDHYRRPGSQSRVSKVHTCTKLNCLAGPFKKRGLFVLQVLPRQRPSPGRPWPRRRSRPWLRTSWQEPQPITSQGQGTRP